MADGIAERNNDRSANSQMSRSSRIHDDLSLDQRWLRQVFRRFDRVVDHWGAKTADCVMPFCQRWAFATARTNTNIDTRAITGVKAKASVGNSNGLNATATTIPRPSGK